MLSRWELSLSLAKGAALKFNPVPTEDKPINFVCVHFILSIGSCNTFLQGKQNNGNEGC